MSQHYQLGDEPIPGAKLTAFLGQGGMGSVWKAHAPGGTELAVKIISLTGARGVKEFQALKLVRCIRHPNLVPLVAFWLKDESGRIISADDTRVEDLKKYVTPISALQDTIELDETAEQRPVELIIAMGLGDRDLAERLRECQQQGLRGIPRDELLRYMDDAARALDFLNAPQHDLGAGPVGIQHCDVKPFNLVLVGDAVQVCDFGLARMVGDVRATNTTAGTVAYVAPECLKAHEPSASTDQYSLAITYHELRTGQLPYESHVVADVVSAVSRGDLCLDALSVTERAVVRRATALDPTKRFDSCQQFVAALRAVASDAPWPPHAGTLTTVSTQRRKLLAVLLLLCVAWIGGVVGYWHIQAQRALNEGRALYDHGQFDEALAPLTRAVQFSGARRVEALLLRGTCYLELNRLDDALLDLSQVLAIEPRNVRAYSRRGNAHLKKGLFQDAIDDLSVALSISPAVQDYHNRGLAYGRLQQYSPAIDDLTQALRLSTHNAWEIYEARAAYELKAADQGLPVDRDQLERDSRFRDFLMCFRDSPEAAVWLARLAEAWKLERADRNVILRQAELTAREVVADVADQNPSELDILAEVLAEEGKFTEASEAQQQAVEAADATLRGYFLRRAEAYRQGKKPTVAATTEEP